jgi:cytochrome c553
MRLFLSIVGALTLLAAAGVAAAADIDAAAAQAQAQRLAVGVCGTCHGPQGNSEQPKFPRLAGQNPQYIAAQLRAFKAQTRGDPDAIGYMWGMAGNLNEAVINSLGDYYAAQKPGAGRRGDAAQIARGKEIYEHGVESAAVPPCFACHGPAAEGGGNYPRLAGQHAQYVLKQLNSFQNNMRDVAIMHGVAQGLKLAEMQAVAAYLQAQP